MPAHQHCTISLASQTLAEAQTLGVCLHQHGVHAHRSTDLSARFPSRVTPAGGSLGPQLQLPGCLHVGGGLGLSEMLTWETAMVGSREGSDTAQGLAHRQSPVNLRGGGVLHLSFPSAEAASYPACLFSTGF